jgi:hypothetical protein
MEVRPPRSRWRPGSPRILREHGGQNTGRRSPWRSQRGIARHLASAREALLPVRDRLRAQEGNGSVTRPLVEERRHERARLRFRIQGRRDGHLRVRTVKVELVARGEWRAMTGIVGRAAASRIHHRARFAAAALEQSRATAALQGSQRGRSGPEGSINGSIPATYWSASKSIR